MGLSVEVGVPALTVFLQGIISFFSPCVLPLVPLYIGYLAGGTKTVDADGTVRYKRSKVIVNTLFFVIGVSFAFFLLGFGFTAAGKFFSGNRALFARIGGIVVVLFGLYQLGFYGSRILGSEHRLPFRLNRLAMNPALALVFGFTFSFAWTPCVGPALASVLLMASSANSSALGFALIGVYTLGFVLPFLAVGLFTGSLLDFFKKHQQVVKYTVKTGGVLMILMGVMMFTGWMNGVTGYLSNLTSKSPIAGTAQEGGEVAGGTKPAENPGDPTKTADGKKPEADVNRGDTVGSSTDSAAEEETKKAAVTPALDFTLTDQFGEEHTLSDYKGKVVFLNFWATWCPPCKREMPDIQKMYEEYGGNTGDLVVLGVANPKTEEKPDNADSSVEEVTKFLEDNGYTYPVLMDTTGAAFYNYYVPAFPTTYMIDREGNIFGYITGSLTDEMMRSIVKQTMDGKREQ